MVKETIKTFYNLVDASNAEDLKAALEAIENTEVKEEVKLSEDKVEEVKKEVVAEAFGDATLEDGETKIYFPGDVLEQGSVVYIDESQETAAGAGEWVLENGDSIVTNDEGIVTEISEAGAPADEEEVEEDLNEESDKVENNQLEEILQAIQPIFDDIYAQLAALGSANEELSKTNDTLEEKLSKEQEKVEKLGKQPAAELYTSSKTTSSDAAKKSSRLASKLKNSVQG